MDSQLPKDALMLALRTTAVGQVQHVMGFRQMALGALDEIERLQRELQELRLQAIADFGQYQEALERAEQPPGEDQDCDPRDESIPREACICRTCDQARWQIVSAQHLAQPPSAGDAGLSGLLEECEQFVNSHSETWYRSGQDLLARIRAMRSRPATPPCADFAEAVRLLGCWVGYGGPPLEDQDATSRFVERHTPTKCGACDNNDVCSEPYGICKRYSASAKGASNG